MSLFWWKDAAEMKYIQAEHPCDEPFDLDSRGNCTLLIEEEILKNGPSRILFSVCISILSVLGLVVGIRKVR